MTIKRLRRIHRYSVRRTCAGRQRIPVSCPPDASILRYPVITSGPFRHAGSFVNLLDGLPDTSLIEKLSLENRVHASTPPTFRWHLDEDAAVPVQNSFLYAQALARHRVPFELHVFPHGVHGLGLPDDLPEIAVWFDLCCAWLKKMGW